MKKQILYLVFMLFAVSWQTKAQVSSFPWNEDFEGSTFPPSGWVKELPDASNDIEQNSDENHTTGGQYSARFSSYNNSTDYNQYLFSEQIHVSAPYTQLKFWHKKSNNSADTLEWGISTTGQSSADVTNWTAVSLSNSDWQEEIINLSAYDGQDIYIAWHYYGDYLYYVYIDDVVIDEPPACAAPTNLSASNIMDTQVDLSWTAGGTETAWNIEYGATGFTQGSGTTLNLTTNPYTLTGLTAETTYDYYVQADCGSGNTSTWQGPYTFTTTPTPGTCGLFRVDLIDSYGDGWNGGKLTVYVNGTAFLTDITLADGTGPESYYIPVDTGDILSFDYTEGSYSGENQYIVYDNNDVEVGNEGENGTTPGDIGDPNVPNGLEACAACASPTDVSTSNITTTQADISWTAGGTETAWNIEYGATGFTIGSGTTLNLTTNPYTLTGLSPNTSYDLYIQADCGNGDTSIWEGPINFMTMCDPQALPYTQDFDTDDDCWQVENANGDNRQWFRYAYSAAISCSSGPSDYVMKVLYNSNEDMDDWLFSPGFNLTAGTNYSISFSYGNDGGSTYLEDMDVYLTTSPNSADALNGTLIMSETGISDGCHDFNDNAITVPNDGVYYVAFHGKSVADQDALMMDDFSIMETPNCLQPTDLSASNITATQADLSWTEGGTETAWNIEYGDAGFTQGQGTTVSLTTNSYTLTGLSPNTSYDYYVQADCGNGDTSSWAGPFSFTTLCDVQSLPYTQDFDADNDCWTVEDTNADGKQWQRATNSTAVSCVSGNGDYVMYISFNSSLDMDDWLFSPGFNLTAGTNYTIAFSYGNDGGSTYIEDMDVYLTTSPNSADAINGTQIMSETGISDGCHDFSDDAITVPNDGVYYVAFHGKSVADQNILMMDDFSIMVTPGAVDELTNVSGIYPNPTTGEFVIKSHDLNNAQVFVYTMTGKEIYHSVIDNDSYTVNLKHINKGVYFVKVTSNDKSFVRKLIIK